MLKSALPFRSRWAHCTALVFVFATLAGCSSLAVWLGLRVRLDKLPVTSIAASMVSKRGGPAVSALGPGQSARLVLVATTQDGKQFATVGAGNGKVAFDNYTIESTIVAVSKRGVVSLSSDPRVSEGKVAHLHIITTAHPEVVTDLDISVRYDIPFVANFSGSDGWNGSDGTAGLDGTSGSDGTPASVDPTTGALGTQGPGGNGTDGGNGGDGSDGQDGSPAAPVHAWVRLEAGVKQLLQIKVSSGSRESLYIVDPSGGSLKIMANGGAGGRGGSGGRGGRGGSGGSGFPSGFSGTDGRAGWNGHAGRGGAGGTITLSVDPAAQPFMSSITWSNHGGDGGSGPAPIITVEPVTPLW
jgi:hypothetical protein